MGGGLNQTPGIQYRGPKPFGRSKDAVGDRLSGEERDSGERTMGVDHRLRKLSLLTPNPPTAGEERDSGERTMGVDHRLRKVSLLTPNPPAVEETGLRRRTMGMGSW
jgi:hypothetical protein